jgi:hypothetical protein
LADAFATLEKYDLPVGGLGESDSERAIRHDATTALLGEVYEVAIFQFGEPRAKAIWAGIPRGKPGRPKGVTRDPAGDASLLRIHDGCLVIVQGAEVKTLPRRIANHLTQKYPKKYPVAAASLEQRIRRLLKARERLR